MSLRRSREGIASAANDQSGLRHLAPETHPPPSARDSEPRLRFGTVDRLGFPDPPARGRMIAGLLQFLLPDGKMG
jgi:hypothetical protein